MASLSDIEHAAADLLVALFPTRSPVRGWYGEAPPAAGPSFYYRTQLQAAPDLLVNTLSADGATQTVSAPASTVALQVSFLGGPAYADAVKLWESLWLSQRTGDLYAGCGLMGVDMPQDLSALQLGATQTRADMTVMLSASVTLAGPGESIGSVGIRVRETPHVFDKTVTISEGTPP